MRALFKILPLVFLLHLFINTTHAQGQLYKYTFNNSGINLPYQLYKPYDQIGKLPLIVNLHGLGSSGNDNEAQMYGSIAQMWIKYEFQQEYQCIVVFPQCPVTTDWDNYWGYVPSFPYDPMPNCLSNLIKYLSTKFLVDTNRIYIAGVSMGGHGVWSMVQRYPNLFAAAIPVCAPNVYHDAKEISNVPLWVVHGNTDNNISVQQSRDMVSMMESNGVKFIYPRCNFHTNTCSIMSDQVLEQHIANGVRNIYSEYNNTGHGVWDSLVHNPYIFANWLFSQCKTNKPVQVNYNSIQKSITCFKSANAFTIELPQENLPCVFQLYNIEGVEMEKRFVNTPTFSFNSGSLQKGVYIIKVKTKNSSLIKKIIIN
jgi:predicted peptidase